MPCSRKYAGKEIDQPAARRPKSFCSTRNASAWAFFPTDRSPSTVGRGNDGFRVLRRSHPPGMREVAFARLHLIEQVRLLFERVISATSGARSPQEAAASSGRDPAPRRPWPAAAIPCPASPRPRERRYGTPLSPPARITPSGSCAATSAAVARSPEEFCSRYAPPSASAQSTDSKRHSAPPTPPYPASSSPQPSITSFIRHTPKNSCKGGRDDGELWGGGGRFSAKPLSPDLQSGTNEDT